MKKLATILTLALVMLTLGSTAMAGGPWEIKVEGNGIVSGQANETGAVAEADFGWNFKRNESGEFNGHLNIVEKMADGTTRHFELSGYEVDLTDSDMVVNCDGVRVEGTDVETGLRVAAYFSEPDQVAYWVKDGEGGDWITRSGGFLTIDNPFSVVCE